MSNDFMSQKSKKEMVKAQLNEFIRLKTESVCAENKALKDKINQLEEELNELRGQKQETTGDDEISRKAGRIIIDAQKTAQKIISDAAKKAEKSEKDAMDRLTSLQLSAKAAENALIRLRSERLATCTELDESLNKIRSVINALEFDKNLK